MVDDAGNDAPAFEASDGDAEYARYLESCRRLGVDLRGQN
jgi:hypothetical protein